MNHILSITLWLPIAAAVILLVFPKTAATAIKGFGLLASLATFIVSLGRFKIHLGLSVEEPIVLKPFELSVPQPDVTMEQAAAAALTYRLDLQNLLDQADDAKRGVRNARNALLPDLNIGTRWTGRLGRT